MVKPRGACYRSVLHRRAVLKKKNREAAQINEGREDLAIQQVPMEGTGLVGKAMSKPSVKPDAASWSTLEPGICEKILGKLPHLERLRLRVVCKDWSRIALERVERKPYFVTIIERMFSWQYLNGVVVYDGDSKSASFEHLPFNFDYSYLGNITPFAVEGLIFSDHILGGDFDLGHFEWLVYNIHTRTTHFLPRAPTCFGTLRRYLCGMTVDTSVKPHTFKLVVIYSTGEDTPIYDLASRSWRSVPNSCWLLEEKDYRYTCMCHKGCMYMSTRRAKDGILVYSIEEGQWTELSGAPFRGMKRPYMGAWNDRIFALLHDAEAGTVTVWELIDSRKQKWLEFARCSRVHYELLMGHDEECEGDCRGEIVSVFCKEYLLMHNWHMTRSFALVMLNLKTREWVPLAGIPNMIKGVDEVGDNEVYNFGGDYGDVDYGYGW